MDESNDVQDDGAVAGGTNEIPGYSIAAPQDNNLSASQDYHLTASQDNNLASSQDNKECQSQQIITNNTMHSARKQAAPEECNLFVFHPPDDVGVLKLAQMFRPFGNVISAAIYPYTLNKNGPYFGFVSFDNKFSAKVAIEAMDGLQIGKETLVVVQQQPLPEGCELFISNLHRSIKNCKLAKLFHPFGIVTSATVCVDKVTKNSKGFGFVFFESSNDAQSAIRAMNRKMISGKRLKVQLSHFGTILKNKSDINAQTQK